MYEFAIHTSSWDEQIKAQKLLWKLNIRFIVLEPIKAQNLILPGVISLNSNNLRLDQIMTETFLDENIDAAIY